MMAGLVGAPERLKLLSFDEMKVNGQDAVKRIYEYPMVDPTTQTIVGTQYNYQVLVMNGKDLYIFRMVTINSDEFEKYKELGDKIITTIVFRK